MTDDVSFDLSASDLDLSDKDPFIEVCRECGEPNDDGEGWNGLCGNCADKAENEKE